MIKNKILVMIAIGLILICTGCANVEDNPYQKGTSMFIQVEDTPAFKVVYHRETKVMYTVSKGSYHYGVVTLLVNADGSPMIYMEDE